MSRSPRPPTSRNHLRQKSNFASAIKLESTVQSAREKYFVLPVGQIISTSSRHPATHKRGVSRSSRTLDAGCDGRFRCARRTHRRRTAKSCGPDVSTLASTRDNALHCARTGARKPDPRGEHEGTRKTIAQGIPDDGVVPVVTMLVCFFTCTRGCGCTSHPAFLAPSLF